MMNEKRDGFEIDLQKLVQCYLRKWWLIGIGTILAAVIGYWFTSYFITPMYRASVTIYVNNIARGEQITYLSGSNLTAAQQLVNTYIQIIGSDTVLTKVADETGLGISPSGIRSLMSAQQVDDTELFKVFITHQDPERAASIANAIAQVAPGEIENFVVGSSTKIIDYAKVPVRPTSPNVSRNVILGGLVGCVLAVVFLTIAFLLDVRINDEEDLTIIFDLPVLAQIPAFVPEGSKRRSGYGYGKKPYEHSAEKGGVK